MFGDETSWKGGNGMIFCNWPQGIPGQGRIFGNETSWKAVASYSLVQERRSRKVLLSISALREWPTILWSKDVLPVLCQYPLGQL